MTLSLRRSHMAWAILALLGMAALFYATTWGIGLMPDSAVYIIAARNLLTGNGYTSGIGETGLVPVTHFPPLYPACLAIVSFVFRMDPLASARGLNILLFGLNIFLAGLWLQKITKNFVLSLIGALFIFTSALVIDVHATALSEALFFTLLLGGFYALETFLGNQRSYIASGIAVLLLALCPLTRYAGLAVFPTVALMFAYKRIKFAKILLFSSGLLLPTALWLLRNAVIAANPVNRHLTFHVLNFKHWHTIVQTNTIWFLPGIDCPPLILGILLLLWLALGAFGFWRYRQTLAVSSAVLLASFCLNYALLLLLTIIFVDHYILINEGRLLVPLLTFALILWFGVSAPLLQDRQHSKLRALMLGLAIGLLVSRSAIAGQKVASIHRNGIGYHSPAWKNSPTLAYVQALSLSRVLYSNAPDALLLLLNRSSQALPIKWEPNTALQNPNYDKDLHAFIDELRRNNGALIYFRKVFWRPYYATETELVDAYQLYPLFQAADGGIYQNTP